jgi:hypothetical protein
MRAYRLGVRTSILAVATAGALLSPGAIAHAEDTTTFSVDVTVPVSGTPKPYKLILHAEHFGTLVNRISLQLMRTAATGNKPTVFVAYTATDSKVQCIADLSSCSLDTRDNMGGYGKTTLAFHASGPATTKVERCRQTGDVLTRTVSRKGTLEGSLVLDTLTEFFKKVTNKNTPVHVPHVLNATAKKVTAYDVSCPGGLASGGGRVPCSGSLSLSGAWLSLDSSLTVSRPLPSGDGRISLFQPFASGQEDLSITHGVLGTAPGGFLTVSDDAPQLQGVHVDFDAFAPFVTGEADFEAQTALTPTHHGECHGRQRKGKLHADDVTMHYEGYGDQPMFGSADQAFTVRRFPPS